MLDSPGIIGCIKFNNGTVKCILEVEIAELDTGFHYKVDGTEIEGFVTELKLVNQRVFQEFEKVLTSQDNYRIVEAMKSRGIEY